MQSSGPTATLKSLVKKMSRGVVFRRHFPDEFGGGKACVSPDIGFKLWYRSIGDLDPELFRAVTMLVGEGDRVWDLGANFGMFSLASAHLVGDGGSVTSVEADTWLVGLMRRSMRARPDWQRIRLIPAAITATVGITEFNIARFGRAANFIGDNSDVAGGIREKQTVVSISLDWLATHVGLPTVIKIDIEGMELEAFRGGDRVLKEGRPRLYLECDEPRQAEATEVLKAYDYRFFSLESASPQELAGVTWNTAVVPAEQAAAFATKACATAS